MSRRRRVPPLELSREEILAGIADYRERFATLLSSLGEQEWDAPSRCTGWHVRDVAGHVTGLFTDVAACRMTGQGLPEVTARQAAEFRDRGPAAMAAEFGWAGGRCQRVLESFPEEAWTARAPGGFPGTFRRAALVLWYELYVHGDDIATAVGRDPDRGPGLRAATAHLAETLALWGWGPATLDLDGVDRMEIRGGGEGEPVTGDARTFVLSATGRADPAALGLDQRVNIYRVGA